ncbi:transglutaminase-like domain-containing protein [Sorangium sp. So ce281]|uniref:SirB1 family protein n=1 Tax=unclassified Sorangium TaxID=2621164 RepID=UPI003F60AD38
MAAPVSLTLFAHIAGRPEDELDLAEAALLIDDAAYPGLDIPHYLGVLDRLGGEARRAVDRPLRAAEATPGSGPIEQLLRWFYGDLGFHGNSGDYYDPKNSYLHEVLDRRTGIPITLAVVLLEVCWRAGLEAQGVSFPGHFLVRTPVRGGVLLIDPFEGRLLGRDDLRALHTRATGATRDPEPRLLVPAQKRQILVRMLNNLRSIYSSRSDASRLRSVLERMQVLAPTDELRKELDQLGGERPWPSAGRDVN